MTYLIESVAYLAAFSTIGQAAGLWLHNQRNRGGIFL